VGSPGTERNAFNLVDLGVCLASIQTREQHPNLGKESPFTAEVAATFSNLYRFEGTQFTCFTRTKIQILTPEELRVPGGHKEFLKTLAKELTENIIAVDWLSPHSYARYQITLYAC